MTKIALITDTHFGARQNSQVFFDSFREFYKDVFFPTLEEHGIQNIYHLGDFFHIRPSLDINLLSQLKQEIFPLFKPYGVRILVGNHDTYYKNTNRVSSLQVLPDNFDVIQQAEEKDGFLFIPWINDENADETMKVIQESRCKVAFGHLDVIGGDFGNNQISQSGCSPEMFTHFDQVFSGHFHKQSTIKNIKYLGAPYAMTFGELDGEKGFYIYDTETSDLEFFPNPICKFVREVYDSAQAKSLKSGDYKTLYGNKFVKVIVPCGGDSPPEDERFGLGEFEMERLYKKYKKLLNDHLRKIADCGVNKLDVQYDTLKSLQDLLGVEDVESIDSSLSLDNSELDTENIIRQVIQQTEASTEVNLEEVCEYVLGLYEISIGMKEKERRNEEQALSA